MTEPPAHPPPASSAPPGAEERERAGRFVAQLHALTPRTPATYVVLAANIAVFVVVVAAGVHWMQPTPGSLLRWGANYGPLTTNGEWWRLLTSMFLHGGIVHLAANMWGLYNIGRFYEQLVGTVGIAVMYLVTGLLASVTSLWWNPAVPSVGASGALFGLFGGLLGYLVRQRATIPRLVLLPLLRNVLLVVGLNVVIAFSIPHLDHAAHLGGLVSGCLLGLLIARPVSDAGRRQRKPAAFSTAVLGAAVILVATAMLPRTANLDRLLETINRTDAIAQERYARATNQRTQGTLSDADYVQLIETEILPAWRAVHDALAAEGNVPASHEEFWSRLRDYVVTRLEFYELRARGIRTGNDALLREANDRLVRARVIHDWLRAER